MPDLRNVKLGYSEGEEEQRLQTMPPQVARVRVRDPNPNPKP